jgi:hypothetical protein
MKKKIINYTGRDFNSIHSDLITYIKKYYPDIFKDYNEASFGALVLDLVSYVGDVESYYLDYQSNEQFLETALENNNIIKIGKEHGYKYRANTSSYGTVSLYAIIPVNSFGEPDLRYAPIIKKGSTFQSSGGGVFMLNEDVVFNKGSVEIKVATVDTTTGLPLTYVMKTYGQVISGKMFRETFAVTDYKKFLRLQLESSTVAEIQSIVDAEGHEYYEVDNLSQNVIYKSVINYSADNDSVSSILKPYIAARRFVTEQNRAGNTFIRFGYGSEEEMSTNEMADPSNTILERTGRDYISDTSFDPGKITKSDKFGVVPVNTTLYVTYRANVKNDTNAGATSVSTVLRASLEFEDITSLNQGSVNNVRSSIEVENENPITGDSTSLVSDELKVRIQGTFSAQKRAVTKQDYKTLVYSMPPEFGSIKRCNIMQDNDSFKRNLNMYVISQDHEGHLTEASETIKSNLKEWLLVNKMINDTIDILDAKIVNFGIEYSVIGDRTTNKYSLESDMRLAIAGLYDIDFDIGESLIITDIYKALKNVEGVVDVLSVKIIKKSGGDYSDVRFNLDKNRSTDGRVIAVPNNVILELKDFDNDIKGNIR